MTFEKLEGRTLFALTVQFDFTYDDANFFDTPEKKAILQAAADAAVSRYADTLAAIVPGGGNTWKAVIDHPATGGNVEIPNLTIPENTLLVFAGARQMSSLGIGGPGGFTSSGTTAWNDLVAARGQLNVRGADARDFGPYGGTITFDTDPSGGWFFGLDETQIAGRSDFFSVALHEMTHLLGFGTSDAWESRVSGALFTGPASLGEFDGTGNPALSADRAHWSSGTNDGGKEAAMDPELTTGSRKTLTALDLAGMDDIGWDIPLAAQLGSANSVTTSGAASTTFTVNYTHYTDIDTATLGTGDLTVTGPSGFNAPASLESVTGTGKSLTVTYSVGAPGGTFDGMDSGTYNVVMAGQSVGDGFGNFAPAGALGSFTVNIDAPPTATLDADDVTQIGGAEHTVAVTYADTTGIDVSSLDVADLVVTRNGDGLALTVTAASVNNPANGSPRTVTYTLAAPGGSWDTGDNGTYTVALAAGQVLDANGTPADAGNLGTFDVTVGARNLSAAEPVTYTDADGGTVTVSLRGPGTGQVLFDDPGNADASAIVLDGTTSATSLTISAQGAGTSLGGLTANGALKSVTARTTDLAGAMTVSGTAGKFLLRNATGSITVNGGDVSTSITLASVHDLGVSSAAAIRLLKAAEWLDTDATPDNVTAPAITSFTVKGASQANVSADVIGKIAVGGQLGGAEVRAGGTIGTVSLGAAADSVIFAGVKPEISTLPDSLDDFSNPEASIRTVTLKGKLAPFSNTRIAAPAIGKASLGSASIGTDAGNPFGLAADRVTSVNGSTTVRGPYRLARLQEPGTALGLIDFAIIVL